MGCFFWSDANARPVSDPSETLALIAEHRLSLRPLAPGEVGGGYTGWLVSSGTVQGCCATIADAVRACVSKLKALDLSDRDP